jgi:tRNA-dihydrouridine synthase A
MLGRAAYHTPWTLARVDSSVYGKADPVSTRMEALEIYRDYISVHLDSGTRLHSITRHILGLFHGVPGARQWRRILSEQANKPGAGLDVLDEAIAAVTNEERVAS